MIWANVTKFGKNFIASEFFWAATPMVESQEKEDARKRQTLKHARRRHIKSKRKTLQSMVTSPKKQERKGEKISN